MRRRRREVYISNTRVCVCVYICPSPDSNTTTVFSGLQVAPEYKPHPLFLLKIWEKFIDKSHLSISRTLFCYLSLA